MATANFVIIEIRWSVQYSIRYLTLRRCSCKQYINILRCLPHLQRLILLYFTMNDSDSTFISTPQLEFFRQVKSLTIKSDVMLMKKIEKLLSLTVSLTFLKLVSTILLADSIIDGSK